MKAWMILICCLWLESHASFAQAEQNAYEIALERIAEARRALNLTGLGLSELPPEIGNLSNLELFYLSNNQLSSLPAEIGNLSSLQTLYLSNNQLLSLPAEIGHPGNLQWLDLSNNHLSSLPAEIGNLSNLQSLHLNNNRLVSLPAEIGKLSNLCFLDLSDNPFESIPMDVRPLKRLGTLEGCEAFVSHGYGLQMDAPLLDSLPADVWNGGTTALLRYLENVAWWHLQRRIASGGGSVGLLATVVLGWRWKLRRGKSKHKNVLKA